VFHPYRRAFVFVKTKGGSGITRVGDGGREILPYFSLIPEQDAPPVVSVRGDRGWLIFPHSRSTDFFFWTFYSPPLFCLIDFPPFLPGGVCFRTLCSLIYYILAGFGPAYSGLLQIGRLEFYGFLRFVFSMFSVFTPSLVGEIEAYSMFPRLPLSWVSHFPYMALTSICPRLR